MRNKTRFVALLMAALLMFSLVPMAVSAAPNPYLQTVGKADFNVSTAFCAHGETTKLFVDISAGSQMSAGLFTLRYDTTMLKAKSVDIGVVLKNGYTSTNITDSGIVKVSYADVNPNYEAGRIFEVEFEAIGFVPEGQTFVDIPVELEITDLRNYEDYPIASNTTDGKITLIERHYGDVDFSGEVSATDALLTLYDNARLITLRDDQKILADVNGDNKVTVTDALQILQYSAGYISNYTIFQLPNPSGLTVTNKEEESLTVSWDEIPYILGYNVFLNGNQVNTVLVNANEYTFNDLTQDTKYDIEIQAVNVLMSSQKSDKLTVSTNKAERMVVFKDYDGTILENQIVLSGTAAEPPEVPGRKGYTFTGWDVDTTNITSDVTITAQYQINTYTVTFDYLYDNQTAAADYVFNTKAAIPDLIPRDNYTLEGWYRDKNFVKKWDFESDAVEADTVLYAKWVTWSAWSTSISDGVTEDDYVIESRTEYRYRDKQFTSSGSSSMDGWTLYDTKRTSWGSTQGPVYSDPSNGKRNVWTEQYVASTTTHHKYYHRYGWGYNVSTDSYGYVWGSDSQLGSGARHEIDLTYALSQGSNFAGNARWTGYRCPHCGESNIWLGHDTYTTNNYATRWYYQDPVYTYYYWKWSDWSKWSTDSVSANDNKEVQTRTVYRYLLKQQ